MDSFKQYTIEKINYYVYSLVDPRNNKVFYIGKGTGNRIFAHIQGIVEKNRKSEKIELIKDILSSELDVIHFIIRHGLTEKEAYEIESAIIDFIGLENLTNIVSGHYSGNRGIKTVEEIKILYEIEEAEIKEKVMLININNLFKTNMNDEEIYEATRKSWIVSLEKANKCEIVMAVYKGVVREVFICNKWEFYEIDKKGKKRNIFYGEKAKEEIRNKYYLKSVEKYWKKGAQNPIKYVNI